MRIALVSLALALPGVAFGQVSTEILWYSGHGGTELDTGTFLTHVSNTLGGSVDFQGSGSWNSLVFADYRYVILGRPQQPFSAQEVADLQAYLANNGLLVIAGDSNAAGVNHITNTNALLTDLGRTMQLQDTNHSTPDNNDDGTPDCVLGEIVNTSSFLQPGNPLSVLNLGDITENNGLPLNNVTIFVAADGTSSTHTMVALEDFVLLTADYDAFTGNGCGLLAKQAFWNGMFGAVCDIDEDGINSALCGGFDCDDADGSVGASFEWLDLDGDSFGDPALTAPCHPDAVPSGDDCDDSDPAINPNADEVCDGVDNDCDGDIDVDVVSAPIWYPDLDNDGHGNPDDGLNACEPPQNHVAAGDDCNDTQAGINPSSDEQCNGLDDNCNNQTDEGCPTGPGPSNPGGDPSEKEGCGCSAGGPASSLLFAAALLGLRRRR